MSVEHVATCNAVKRKERKEKLPVLDAHAHTVLSSDPCSNFYRVLCQILSSVNRFKWCLVGRSRSHVVELNARIINGRGISALLRPAVRVVRFLL